MKYYKTTIVIYSAVDPMAWYDLSDLAREAEIGDAICTSHLVDANVPINRMPDEAREFFKDNYYE